MELTHQQTGPGLGGNDVGCVHQFFRSRLFHGVSPLVYTDNLHSAICRPLACLSAEDKKAGSALSLLGGKLPVWLPSTSFLCLPFHFVLRKGLCLLGPHVLTEALKEVSVRQQRLRAPYKGLWPDILPPPVQVQTANGSLIFPTQMCWLLLPLRSHLLPSLCLGAGGIE